MNTTHLTKLHSDMLKYLTIFEGYEHKVYKDSLGNLTVGIGHKLVKGDNIRKNARLNDIQIETLFIKDCEQAEKTAKSVISNYETQPYKVKLFLNLMSFNLGHRLASFKIANKHLKNFNYGFARLEYLNSKWYKQVGEYRAIETTNLLRFKQWKL